MAGEDRLPDPALDRPAGLDDAGASAAVAALFDRLEARPWSFHLYMALRAIEAAFADHPRLGRSTRLRDDPVRFGQEPALAFAPATLAAFVRDGRGAPRLDSFAIGLFGPNGPLPLHLTEYARDREHNSRDATFRAFADLFHHRIVQLFYRAWAESQPVAHADRPRDDRFAFYVGALGGLGLDALGDRTAFPDHVRRHWAGLFGMPTRPAEGLRRVLEGFFALPVHVHECSGQWIRIPPPMRTRLALAESRLGDSATLGEAVWDAAGKFRVIVGPVGLADFRRLLPGHPSLRRLAGMVDAWVDGELVWDLQVILRRDEVPATRLDRRSALGYTSWVLSRPATRDARDYVLDAMTHAGASRVAQGA
jgi:type VI secretion system protein ImpH